jgi:hypothetical protein
MGAELVGREPAGLSRGCYGLRTTLCGLGDQRALSWLCDSRGVDGVTGGRETCLARRVATNVASGTNRRAASLLCDGSGGSRFVRPLALSGHYS